VADATLQILGLGTSAVPLDYTVSGPQTLDLIAVKGDFDGSAAGVDFFPVVQIISPAGAVMATSTGPTITAGSSATVTFAPFLRSAATASGGGIQFDTQPQAGQFLYVEADGPGTTADSYAIQLNDTTGNGIGLTSPVLIGFDQVGAPRYRQSGFGFIYEFHSTGQLFRVSSPSADAFKVLLDVAGVNVGFFGATPVPQQPTPATLADVIALLQAYGLSA
jgi:hypothetical protein